MSQDKDELAKLLGEMAAGEHTDEDAAHHEHDDDHVGPLAEPAPPPPAPAPIPKSIPSAPIAKSELQIPATPPRPTLKPSPPKPAAPSPRVSTPPPPTAATPPRPPVKPALPPRPAPVIKPIAPAPIPKPPTPPSPPASAKPLLTPRPIPTPLPTPIPQPSPPAPASAPIISDEEEPERYSGTDDDAVIVPALASSELAKPHAPLPRRQHLSQKLYFKQTIIPILLTLGLICLLIPVLGLLSSPYSPFKALSEMYFMATFWPLGLAFLVFAILTMFTVKKELASTASTLPTPD